ncbi:hypothetical protein CL617_02255 [archaeon]|nr:hypothetical protein [archaeon]|tara:strand:+ start:2250 stop:2591 length:342 start_codon:yes stop_codon:yes gene_type:complete
MDKVELRYHEESGNFVYIPSSGLVVFTRSNGQIFQDDDEMNGLLSDSKSYFEREIHPNHIENFLIYHAKTFNLLKQTNEDPSNRFLNYLFHEHSRNLTSASIDLEFEKLTNGK